MEMEFENQEDAAMAKKRIDITEAVKCFEVGEQTRLQDLFGVRCDWENGKYRYNFRLYAPNAVKAELTGDFNSWGSEKMIPIYGRDIWETQIESEIPLDGLCYKYRVYNDKDVLQLPDMCDSYGQCDNRDESIVYTRDEYRWMTNRIVNNVEASAVNILECRTEYYKNALGGYLNYRDIAERLCGEAVELGYTHICLKLNNQAKRTVFGLRSYCFTPPARHGRPEDFMYLVDRLHSYGVCVVVELNIPTMFEMLGISPCEESLIQSCMVSTYERFRLDGVVIAAEKNKSRETDVRGKEELLAEKFRTIVERVKCYCPDIVLIAGEEITNTLSEENKLFDLYINSRVSEIISNALFSSTDTRKYKYSRLNYELMNCFERRCIIPFPEVKAVMEDENKYDGFLDDIRLAYSYVMFHPGKKMMCCYEKNKERSELKNFLRRLNSIYRAENALWENDFSWKGFEWIQNAGKERGVSAFIRYSNKDERLCVINFDNKDEMRIRIPINGDCTGYDCIFDSLSDEKERIYIVIKNGEKELNIILPPKCARIYKPALLFEYEGMIEKM